MKRRINILRNSLKVSLLTSMFACMPAALAAPLDCLTYSSAIVAVPYNTWTAVDAYCPADRTSTGGGYFFNEGSGGVANIWAMPGPLNNGWRTWVVHHNVGGVRHVTTYARCCKTF
ncbi:MULTISPECIES: hypothetical protein [unclassified Lysobacter]|uniref:hypothetical protein n=1 Tax=unclassified Lysobacter TaxID=2635362 RepID=UPI001BEA1394|nr:MULTISPECIES: hypothetical protein [unclassified Lysobacter]MBT2746579.1 hypothetical protein [Lysobacter sp. ISL-42]MBT2753426.1 hypothetical protein [Lysobacter sp. ISL-50]MBT2775536.1 hypothetical protein [Lysobacter sp. ISL-54]MBT2782928.1 hypothetical protein [Lysobacter sp. ISL-52]